MKICIISNLYQPHSRGGAEKVAEMMAAGFVAAGHSVVVISTKPAAGLAIEQQSGRCRIYRFRPLNLFYYLNDYKHAAAVRLLWHFIDMFNVASALTVRGILRAEKPDVVVTHNLKGIGLLIPRIIKREGSRHLHVLHDVQLVIPSGLIIKSREADFTTSGWPTKIYAGICRWLFAKTDVAISPSKWLLDFYSANSFFENSKKIVARNPVVGDEKFSIARVNKPMPRRFLFVGQIEKHKGVEWLIDFWKKNNIKNELLVVGDGSLSDKLARVCHFESASAGEESRGIKLLGKVEGAQLSSVFVDTAFLIIPSLCYENSPTVIQLAFQNGVPVIVADIGGAAELVENNKTGFVFTVGNEESFAVALKRANNLSVEDYKKMVDACLIKAEEFGLGEYVEKVLSTGN
jgi:glycosyltransferase involved in cell wall biosynthesis